ncbi:MAG: hypothetical protein ACFFAS_17650 [Promethearchaeota archaeon]
MVLLYALLLIFEIFYRNTRYSRRQTMTTILVFLIIGGIISEDSLDIYTNTGGFVIDLKVFSPSKIFEFVFTVFASIFIIYMLIKSRKNAWNLRQKRAILGLMIGSLIGVLAPLLFDVLFEIPIITVQIDIVNTYIIQSLVQTLGILTIGIIFLTISNNPWLLQHQKIYFLITFSHQGIELYSKTFSENISSHETILLAGAFSAISMLIKDGAKSTSKIESISLKDKILKIINRPDFICALLVDYSTQACEEAHKNFTLEFENRFRLELDNFSGEVSEFKAAEKFIDKYFS